MIQLSLIWNIYIKKINNSHKLTGRNKTKKKKNGYFFNENPNASLPLGILIHLWG